MNRRFLREDVSLTIDVKVLRASALKHLENGRYEDSRQIFEQIIGIGTVSTQMLSDHRQRRAIFHRARRVVAFELDENGVQRHARHALQTH